MNSLDAVAAILEQVKEPLHYRELTRRILDQGLWNTEGKTPEATISANLGKEIHDNHENSRFQRVGPGLYALRQWGLSDYVPTPKAARKTTPTPPQPSQQPQPSPPPAQPASKRLSFADAAEHILDNHANKQPMHYRAITAKMLALGLVQTEGQTPEATLYAQILTEINRQTKRGDAPRFTKHGKGYFGLRKWLGQGLAYQIRQHNNEVRKKLLAQLHQISAADFEELIAQLLVAIGFEDVDITPLRGDKGIDVRGTLVVGDVIRTHMAVQAKKWKKNVQAPVVQQVRGSLGAHDQGLIITTSDFSAGAYQEAERSDAIPVALMNGKQLVELLIENDIGVQRTTYQLIEMDQHSNQT
jgi:restriction system protein